MSEEPNDWTPPRLVTVGRATYAFAHGGALTDTTGRKTYQVAYTTSADDDEYVGHGRSMREAFVDMKEGLERIANAGLEHE